MGPLFVHSRNVYNGIWRNLAEENSEMRTMSNVIFPFCAFLNPTTILDFGFNIVHVLLVLGEFNAAI